MVQRFHFRLVFFFLFRFTLFGFIAFSLRSLPYCIVPIGSRMKLTSIARNMLFVDRVFRLGIQAHVCQDSTYLVLFVTALFAIKFPMKSTPFSVDFIIL